MKKSLLSILLFTVSMVIFQNCKPSQAATSSVTKADEPVLSYEKDIRPFMVASCTPCHFPDGGKKKMLDTHAATKTNITDIVARVEMGVEEDGYMPFKSKKPALTAEQIQMLKTWAKQGYGE